MLNIVFVIKSRIIGITTTNIEFSDARNCLEYFSNMNALTSYSCISLFLILVIFHYFSSVKSRKLVSWLP